MKEDKRLFLNDETYPLSEGGHAFSGALKIAKEKIQPTLLYFEEAILRPVLNIELSDCSIVGSTGKKPESGDIDLAIPFTALAPETTEDEFFHHYPYYLIAAYGKLKEIAPQSVLNLVFKQIHAAVPLIDSDGHRDQSEGLVQLDMIFGNINYLQWSLASSPGETAYESWVRNALLSSLGRTKIVKNWEDKKIHYQSRLSYSVNSGLVSKFEYWSKFSPEEKLLLNIDLLSSNPDEIADLLFSLPELRGSDILTAEQVITQIKIGIQEDRINRDSLEKEFQKFMSDNNKTGVNLSDLLGREE